jgi:phosphohistidine phosphatase SixA
VTTRTPIVLALVLGVAACGTPPEPPPPAADAPAAGRSTGEGPPSVFFLVRHAEKVDQSEDPPLTERGQSRARELARLLKSAGVERIYSSDFVRTRDTAAPLAGDLGLAVTLYDPSSLPDLAQALLASPGRALVVGHSNTTPELAGLLGGDPGPPIPETEYDRLYVPTRGPGGDTTTVVLRLEP